MSNILLLVLSTLAILVLGVLVIGLWTAVLGLKQPIVTTNLILILGITVLSSIAFVGVVLMYIQLVLGISKG